MAEEAVIRIVIEGGGGGDGNTPTDTPGPDRTFTARARRESTKSSESTDQTTTPTPSSEGNKVAQVVSQILEVSAVSALSELTAAVENVRENINTVAEEITSPKTVKVAGSDIANDTNKLPDANGLEATTELPDTLGPIDDVNDLINSLNEWSEVYEDLAEANKRIVDSVEMVTPPELGEEKPKELPEVTDAEFEVIEPPTPPTDYGGMIPYEGPSSTGTPPPPTSSGGMSAPPPPPGGPTGAGGGMGQQPGFAWSGWPYGRNYKWTGWGGPGSGHGFPGPPPGSGVPTGWAGGPPGGGFNWVPNPPQGRWTGWQGPAASGTGMGAPPGGLTWHPGGSAGGPFGAGGGIQGMMSAALPYAAIAAAVLQVDRMVKSTLKGVISSVGDAATVVAGANADPGMHVAKFGEALSKVGESIPLFGTQLLIVGESVKAFGSVMQAITQTAERYGEFSPQIAQAQAIAEIRHTLGDLRRSREVSGEMAKYLIAQSDLQQKFEDVKVKILVKMLPVMTRILELIESVVPSGKGIEFQIGMLIDPMETMAKLFAELLHMKKEENLPKIEDPTSQLFDPKFMNAAGIPGEWTPGN